jgi:hypothetical protein
MTEPYRKEVRPPGCTVGVLLVVPFWLAVAAAARWC